MSNHPIRVRGIKFNLLKGILIRGKGFEKEDFDPYVTYKICKYNEESGEMDEVKESTPAEKIIVNGDKLITAQWSDPILGSEILKLDEDVGGPSLAEIEVTVTNPANPDDDKDSTTEDIVKKEEIVILNVEWPA